MIIILLEQSQQRSLKGNLAVLEKMQITFSFFSLTHITFSVPIKKEIKKTNKNGEEITKTISYKLKLIDSTIIMASSISNLADNLAEGIHKIKCKYRHDNNKCEECGIKYKDCECYLQYTNIKDDLLVYKCSCCNKNYQKKFDEDLSIKYTIHLNGFN